MNWLSFFIGVLVGWIVEWLVDVFYWRRRGSRGNTEEGALPRTWPAPRRMRSACGPG